MYNAVRLLLLYSKKQRAITPRNVGQVLSIICSRFVKKIRVQAMKMGLTLIFKNLGLGNVKSAAKIARGDNLENAKKV